MATCLHSVDLRTNAALRLEASHLRTLPRGTSFLQELISCAETIGPCTTCAGRGLTQLRKRPDSAQPHVGPSRIWPSPQKAVPLPKCKRYKRLRRADHAGLDATESRQK